MAYLTLVAAVPQNEIDAIRTDERKILTPTLVTGVSHLLAYRVEVQPLGAILARIIDGGQVLHESFWHPLRPPMVHPPGDIASLSRSLEQEWARVRVTDDAHDDWLEAEMERLIAVLSHAGDNDSAVVTALDLPADRARARRTRLPWQPHSHGDRRRRWWWMPWPGSP